MLGLLWYYDPLFIISLFIAYILGFIAINILAHFIAPIVARRISGKFSFYTSMYLAATIVFVGGFSAIYLLWLGIEWIGYTTSFLFLITAIVVMNIITYIMSPFLINSFYGARHDEELQKLVNEAAARAGIKPPKAVIVNGPPNAFAYGNFVTGKYVAVTTGMMKITNRSELLGVIGHELGHHKHRDNFIMLFMGIIPSILYYMGLLMIRAGIIGGYGRDERSSGGNGLLLLLIGVGAILLSLIVQVFILAFSRLREYYADAHGASIAGKKPMQKALAKLHLYYSSNSELKNYIDSSKLRTLFIYAIAESVAEPFYSYFRRREWLGDIDDGLVEELKRMKTDPVKEFLSSHPPIPKRLKFIDSVEENLRANP